MINEEKTEEQMPDETEEATAEVLEDQELEETLKEEETIEPAPEPAEEKEEEEVGAKPEKKKKGKEEEIVEERIYVIPLGKASVRPPKKRAPRAIQLIRAFITKHMKLEMRVEEEEEEAELPKLTISQDVNEKIWGRGIEKPPKKIRVRAAKDKDGNVTVYLAEGE
ncbi:MAG TPA: 50S ribosomal protein L31e [Candidatus Bathyarchaeia archaeon]|nr:50S ribosomal protein L31e [Candidatus Bathyarchaeia archaeon]